MFPSAWVHSATSWTYVISLQLEKAIIQSAIHLVPLVAFSDNIDCSTKNNDNSCFEVFMGRKEFQFENTTFLLSSRARVFCFLVSYHRNESIECFHSRNL